MTRPVVHQLEGIVEELLGSIGLELVDIEYRKEKKTMLLRIFIDSDSGVNIDTCAKASHVLKGSLDDMQIEYDQLEVSSPGLDRVIKKDKDLVKFRNYMVTVKMNKMYDGPRKLKGILKGFDGESIIIEIDNREIMLPRDKISTIKLQPEF